MNIFPRLYDAVMGIAERGRVGRLRRAMVSKARGRVLEIGAGTGLDFPYYQTDAWVVASDPDLDMLRRGRRRAGAAGAEVLLVAADAELLPFRDGAFDAAIVGLAMCTIPHPERALAELRRTLRPGAALRLLEHVRMEQPLLGRLQDWLTPVWRRVAGGCRLNRRTADAVAAGGFAVDSVDSHLGGYLQVIDARRTVEGPTPSRPRPAQASAFGSG